MRNIDWTKPLSEDDKAWLRDRDRHAEIDAHEAQFSTAADDEPADDDDEITESETGADVEDVEIEDDYDDWKLAELKDEANGRTPPVDIAGLKKDQIITALRVWDGEHGKTA